MKLPNAATQGRANGFILLRTTLEASLCSSIALRNCCGAAIMQQLPVNLMC
jgi:hypothetical protein